MSHPQQLFFVGGIKQFLGELFQHTKVLEIGSLDINGSVRSFFEIRAGEKGFSRLAKRLAS